MTCVSDFNEGGRLLAAEKFQITKRKAVAVVAATAVFAIVSASAATLGGLDTKAFGADQGVVVAPVEGGVTLTWNTEYSAKAREYVLEGINIAATDRTETIPELAEVKVTLTDTTGAELVEYVSDNGGADWTAHPVANSVAAEDVAGAAVVINDRDVTVTNN